MKDYLLKFKGMAMIVMMLLAVTAVSCSDDDDEPEDSRSFFDTHANTVWKIQDPTSGATVFVEIKDNVTNLIGIWLSIDGECYLPFPLPGIEDPEILEDSENRIRVKISETESDYQIVTASVSGDFLSVSLEVYENGVKDEEESQTFVLFGTNEKIADLVLCQI